MAACWIAFAFLEGLKYMVCNMTSVIKRGLFHMKRNWWEWGEQSSKMRRKGK